MAILITGGAGFIGSVTTRMLYDNKKKVIVIDDLSEGKSAAVPEDIPFYKANFGDRNLLKDIFNNYDINKVIHFAASANVPDSVINPQKYYTNNLINTLNLLNMMQEYDVKNIIFSSTAAVYGDPEYIPIDENHPIKPINPYGFSKLFNEQIIQDYSKAYGLNYIIFRYFGAAGATVVNGESRDKETHLIPLVIDAALDPSKEIKIFGRDFPTKDGTGVRDYIHVYDIAFAHKLALEAVGKVKNIILNLGTEVGYSVKEIILLSENILNKEIKKTYADKREGDPAILVASNKLAKKILNWKPQNDIYDIIKSASNWRKAPKY